MQESHARFMLGQLVHHRLFDYRGVIVDVDPVFLGSDAWYEQVARTRPPKEEPWYHVLVHDAEHQTYVAERNLELDLSKDPIVHPELSHYFDAFREGSYFSRRRGN